MADFQCERPAVMRTNELLAECPLGCTCSENITDPLRLLSCGYFNGTISDQQGLRVVCGYEERSSFIQSGDTARPWGPGA